VPPVGGFFFFCIFARGFRRLIANYTYDLVKEFNSFYQQVSILGEENHDKKVFRVQLSKSVGNTIKNAFQLLGIEVPERM
jgi:arginyl-tRNA synthetase